MAGKSAQDLWQDYYFLTKEMLKFLIKQDMELFYDLMNQRERLQILIEQTADDGYKQSLAGRSLLREVKLESQHILEEMLIRMGKTKRQHQVSKAYNAASTTAVSQMNWKR